ncbi:type 4a pilus biogenesis protein PilO [Patescibacteria group bacterium]|nr:type 4a pilus biogenesis protein PilO [Patescibacteria group bacterium]
MIELNREKLITIIAAGVVIISAGLYLLLYRPLINKCRLAGRECRGIETEVSRAYEAINLLKQNVKKRTFVFEKDISIAMDELTKEGRSKGINFTSITPGKIENSGNSRCKILPIDIDIESTYKELALFLGSLEELDKGLVTVKNINITSDKEKKAKLKTRLILNMYLSYQ